MSFSPMFPAEELKVNGEGSFTEKHSTSPLVLTQTVYSQAYTKEASVLSGTLNLTNTILGAGMLALPFGFAQLGIVFGIIMLVLFCIFSYFSLFLLAQLAQWHTEIDPNTPASYGSCARKLFPWSSKLIEFAIVLKLIGVMVSYLIIASDIAASVFVWLFPSSNILIHPPQFWLLVIVCVLTPLCFFQRLDAQRFASTAAMISVFVIVGVILSFPFWGHPKHVSGIVLFKFSTKLFTVLPIFIFSFCCHQNMFTVANEFFPQKRRQKSYKAIITSSCITLPVFLAVGIAGYLTIGPSVDSNILNSYPQNVILAIARICLMLLISFSFPLQFHPGRFHLDSLLFSNKDANWFPILRHVGITVFLILTTFSISFFIRKLSLVLGIVGATGSTLMVYILPGLFYWKAFAKKSYMEDKKRIIAFILFVFGCFISVFCVTFQILNETVLKDN